MNVVRCTKFRTVVADYLTANLGSTSECTGVEEHSGFEKFGGTEVREGIEERDA